MTEISVDLSSVEYEFNPPLHPSLYSATPHGTWVSYGNGPSAARSAIYNETANTYASSAGEEGSQTFHNLRLGRIFNARHVFRYTGEGVKRYGFRFLYNPPEVTGSQNVGRDFIPNPATMIGLMLPMGLENINFQILLNRTPEVQGGAKASDYTPTISPEELEHLQERGTHYDLEYIYRIANGRYNTQTRDQTGDLGVLLPNPSELVLGPFRSYGAVITVSATDKMYSAEMVPMLTEVQISFQRFMATKPNEEMMETLRSTGVSYTGEDTGGSVPVDDDGNPIEGTDGSAGFTGVNEGQPETGNDVDGPVPGYNRVTTGWYYSDGTFHGAWDYGHGDINHKKVVACRGGLVHAVITRPDSYGNHVIIRTGNIYTYYCHLAFFDPSLKKGQQIKPGTTIGYVGSTGNSSGPHLHYEEKVDNSRSRTPQWSNRMQGDSGVSRG